MREQRAKFEGQIYSIKSDYEINDGKWHSVVIVKQLANRQWVVIVDDKKEYTKVSQLKDINAIQSFRAQVLYVGGVPTEVNSKQVETAAGSTNSLRGCIRDLVINEDAQVNDQNEASAAEVNSNFAPSFNWNFIPPGLGSTGYSTGCTI